MERHYSNFAGSVIPKTIILRLSTLSETLIGSEIVKLGGEIREKIRKGEKIFNYTVGDFDPSIFPIPEELEEAIISSYRNHFTNYPSAEGNPDLRESLSAFIKHREGLHFGLNEILVAAGGRPLIYAAYRAVCDKGEKVIYAVPSWNNNHYTHFIEGEHVAIEAGAENNFMPSAADIRPHLAGCSLLSLCSPQNPTGTTFTREGLAEICDLVLEENQRRTGDEKKLYVLYDQMYWQLTYDGVEHVDPVSLRPEMKAYTIYIDAISKVFASTGVRVGWALGPEHVIGKMKAILTHVGAWAPMAEQKALAKYLTQYEAIDRYLVDFKTKLSRRLHTIYNGFKQLQQQGYPVDAIAPQAAIYLTVKIDLSGSTGVHGKPLPDQPSVTTYLLNTAGIALVPFSAFGAPKSSPWYRLSVGTCREEEIEPMLNALREAMDRLSE